MRRWYPGSVRGTYTATMGDRGRLVVPAELRERVGLNAGTVVVMVETTQGVLLVTREQLRDLVRSDLRGKDLVRELLNDRRAAASADDAS